MVTVLRTHPVVYMDANMDFYPSRIDTSRHNCRHEDKTHTCVAVGVAFRYSGVRNPDSLDIEIRLDVDTLMPLRIQPQRGYVKSGNDSKLLKGAQKTISLRRDQEYREDFVIVLSSSIADIITPMRFHLSYALVPEVNAMYKDVSTRPVLDANYPNSITKEVSFLKACGADNECITDLRVSMNANQPYVILGQHEHLVVNIQLFNNGEPAYQPQLTLIHPDNLKFVRVEKKKTGNQVACLPLPTDEHLNGSAVWVCEAISPMPASSLVEFAVVFDATKVDDNKETVEVVVSARTRSTENSTLLADNKAVLRLPVHVDINLDITSVSIPEQISYEKDLYNHLEIGTISDSTNSNNTLRMKHLFDIKNIGPGLLPFAELTLRMPGRSSEGIVLADMLNIKAEADGQSKSAIGQCLDQVNIEIPRNKQNRTTKRLFSHLFEAVEEFSSDSPTLLDCNQFGCIVVTCIIGDVAKDDSVLVTWETNLQLDNILQVSPSGSAYLIVEAYVNASQHSLSLHQKHFKTTITTPVFPKDHASRKRQLQFWLIVGSSTFGVLLLIFIILIMQKMGFFVRRELDEIKKLLKENMENEEHEDIHLTQDTVMEDFENMQTSPNDIITDENRNGILPLLRDHIYAETDEDGYCAALVTADHNDLNHTTYRNGFI